MTETERAVQAVFKAIRDPHSNPGNERYLMLKHTWPEMYAAVEALVAARAGS